MKRRIIIPQGIIFFIIILNSCTSNPSKIHSISDTLKNKTLQNHESFVYNDIGNQIDYHILIKEIESSDCVLEEHVGLAGNTTRTFECFKRLCELVGDSTLLELTHSKNDVLKVYAYRGLLQKKSNLLNSAKTNLENDHQKICWFAGCSKIQIKVSDLINGMTY